MVHVDDILFSGSAIGRSSFDKVISNFRHSGVIDLAEKTPLHYLGLDLTLVGESIRISQRTYAQEKLILCAPTDVVQEGVFKIDEGRRRTVAKQLIGALLWITQTRLGLNLDISVLSSSMIASLHDPVLCRSW